MKLTVSLKTLVLVQGVLVIGTVFIPLEYVLPLYTVLWVATWLEVSKLPKYFL